MTSPVRTSLSALPAGHELAPATFSVSPERVASYLAATGDPTPYGDAVPPLCIVALGLAAVQEQVSLPDGALHTSQDLETHGIGRVGEELRLAARIAQRSQRQGYVISVVELAVEGADGPVLRARATIMAPAAA